MWFFTYTFTFYIHTFYIIHSYWRIKNIEYYLGANMVFVFFLIQLFGYIIIESDLMTFWYRYLFLDDVKTTALSHFRLHNNRNVSVLYYTFMPLNLFQVVRHHNNYFHSKIRKPIFATFLKNSKIKWTKCSIFIRLPFNIRRHVLYLRAIVRYQDLNFGLILQNF